MKIPWNAQCVFQGVLFDVYQWQQEMFDGSYETFEVARRPDSVQVIPTYKGHVFLAEEHQPNGRSFWGFFGGRKEPDEEPLAAAQRELYEESGMVSGDWELYTTYPHTGHVQWTTHLYVARQCQFQGDPAFDPGEKIKLRECRFEEFLELLQSDQFRAKELVARLLPIRIHRDEVRNLERRLFP